VKLLVGAWLTALVVGCVGVYILGAAEEVVERWRTRRWG
jgi:hypothetical protein